MARIAGMRLRERWADWGRQRFTSESGSTSRSGRRSPRAAGPDMTPRPGDRAAGDRQVDDGRGRRPELGAPVLGHDWVMSGLRPYPEMQTALDAMDPPGHRGVGWSLLWALARSQLRRGSSVVLDGVAREPEVVGTRLVAAEEGAAILVVMTTCADVDSHRSRVEGRSASHSQLVRARSGSTWQAGSALDAGPARSTVVLEATDGRRKRRPLRAPSSRALTSVVSRGAGVRRICEAMMRPTLGRGTKVSRRSPRRTAGCCTGRSPVARAAARPLATQFG